MKLAVIGDSTTVAGFRPLGFEVFPVAQPEEARGLWAQVKGGDYAVVFVTEAVADTLGSLLAEVADLPTPAITVIPGVGSRGGVGQAKIDKAVERALGTTALIREEES